MTKNQLFDELHGLGFSREYESEYNREYFKNDGYVVENLRDFPCFEAYIVVLVDYHNVTLRWYHKSGHKVSKSLYIHRDLPGFNDAREMITKFIEYCIDYFRINPVV